MAQITLKRFKNLETYLNSKSEGTIKDGDLFIISDTKQLGTNCKGNYILTPSNTLQDYVLPDGEIVITSHDSISRAIAKLEYRVNAAKILAETAINTVSNLEELENVTDTEAALLARITDLENRIENLPKHVCLSETAYSSLESEGIDQNTVYFIYAND